MTHERGHGAGVRTFGRADLFRVMVFAQITWRESLRDTEACLQTNHAKLYHIGLKGAPARTTLADVLNLREWRIHGPRQPRHALAMHLIVRARELYATEPLGIDLDATVYALNATTIDLCLSLFDWAPFRSTKAAIKVRTLLDLRGAIPEFIHMARGHPAWTSAACTNCNRLARSSRHEPSAARGGLGPCMPGACIRRQPTDVVRLLTGH